MEEVGAQVASPIFIHQALSSRFCDAASMAKKRDLSYQTSNFQHHRFPQNPRDNWNPKAWDWDSVRFVAKPLDADTNVLQLGTASSDHQKKTNASVNHNLTLKNAPPAGDEDDGLRLNLAGVFNAVEEPVSRPNKRVRSGSPGTATYPMCQVDNCKEDLSNAKDYHRRHKVCELHSKSTQALVGKQMQRFCQQCSRFHPLSEFDEGKRSCRRRLAGHNRRRRKTQPEDVTSRLLLPGNRDTASSANLDIVNLLTALARTQGKHADKRINASSMPDRDQLIQILSKINSLPLPMDLAAQLSNIGSLNRKNPEQPSSEHQNRLLGTASSPSTMDLLAVLSATLAASAPDALAFLSQRSSQSSDSEKSKLTCVDQDAGPNLQKRPIVDFPSMALEKSSSCYQSPVEESDCQLQESHPNLPLQLFSSSPEESSPPKLASSRKYFSSDSSNPSEGRSPSSSPPVMQKLFPLQSNADTVKSEKVSITREVNANIEGSRSHGSILPLELFRGSDGRAVQSSYQSFPYQAGYTSSSGSDHSPSSQNSDAQDRTGRIIFKLFDKDPSHFPGKLRTQIYNWLSNSPSEMESYIRPGCVVLSVYLSMSSAKWERLERNLLQQVDSLVQDSYSDFWRTGRFLLHTGRQLASHKDGNIRLCKSWRTWSSPELISVSPVAVVGGQETSLLLRGRNLTNAGTKIHCTYMGGYTSMEVMESTLPGAIYDEINMSGFKVHGSPPSSLGRLFIEVENGFKGNSFPVIVADATICKELRLLECEFDEISKDCDIISEEQAQYLGRPKSREEALHFLNELGWLFQRRRASSVYEIPDYSLGRFKFLLIFSVERDYCALVKTILDMLVERNMGMSGLSKECLEMLSEIHLVNRAVKRQCRKMVDLLIHYYINCSELSSKSYIFPPSLAGPGGITPLHLAACTSGSDDLVDALTNDPQEIGLSCWNSLVDANHQSPYDYATMTDNHSYNKLVAHKHADRRNGQVSVRIGNEIVQSLSSRMISDVEQERRSCARCATVAAKYNRRIMGSQGLLQRPYIHSMLAIAAVCVCVCLFLRGAPDIGLVAPFKWETLDYGTI
ncbi:Squamosa promoter-binding protein, putative [Ricinus communis]|uniref:Squamosa promoter-binding protein, putative n=1 Tax=Ricinus communis TaxID=3988 RepID=B9R8V3_RICCO|nr:Squamosa promoter-binding protein, putative [Ricinus communis]|eukprot:XP_002510746.1 squamosa promoter-binding-like protein 14 [Ricinus communis]